MKNKKPDKKPDISPGMDRGESLTLMEPMRLSDSSPEKISLSDLALTLVAKSAGFKHSLPAAMQSSLADAVRAMNCYYSNLIEGHDTHPIDIERALQGDYSNDHKKRELQLEAKSHIAVQAWIDAGGLRGRVYTRDALCEIHQRFYENLSANLLITTDPLTQESIKIVPGKLRHRDVKVGQHVAVSAGAVPRFLTRFETAYGECGQLESLLALAASHHRLLWIHPFLDGNGRVARLLTHAILSEKLDTGGLWSLSRGFARQVQLYKQHLAACDMTKRNDLDGRGHLSQEALIDFTRWTLETAIDQVDFMQKLMEPSRLRARILLWAKEEIAMNHLPPQTITVLEALLYRGEVGRGEMAALLNVSDRHARRLLSPLAKLGILVSDEPKSALKLGFPAALASRWMPGLFPMS